MVVADIQERRHKLKCPQCGSMEGYDREWHFDGELPPELIGFKKKIPLVRAAAEAPQCPVCGGQTKLRERKSDGHSFWGCMSYPRCKGAVNFDDGDEVAPPLRQNSSAPGQLKIKERSMTDLMILAANVLGGVSQAKKWFSIPKYSLDYKTPFDAIDTKEGQRRVKALLEEIARDSNGDSPESSSTDTA